MLRICIDCLVPKSPDEFYYNPSRTDRLQTRCKPCYIARQLAYYYANQEQYKGAALRYIDKLKRADPERLAANRKRAEATRDKSKIQHNNRLRKMRIRQVAIQDLSNEQWQEILIAFDFRCAYCPPKCWRCQKKKHRLTQDHIDPVSRGGNHTLWNVVPACRACNSKKRTGPPLNPVQPLLLTLALPQASRAS